MRVQAVLPLGFFLPVAFTNHLVSSDHLSDGLIHLMWLILDSDYDTHCLSLLDYSLQLTWARTHLHTLNYAAKFHTPLNTNNTMIWFVLFKQK